MLGFCGVAGEVKVRGKARGARCGDRQARRGQPPRGSIICLVNHCVDGLRSVRIQSLGFEHKLVISEATPLQHNASADHAVVSDGLHYL